VVFSCPSFWKEIFMEKKSKHLGYADLESEYGIKRGTAYSKVSKREIPHVRIGPRHVLFDREEIERWIDEHRVPEAAQDHPPAAVAGAGAATKRKKAAASAGGERTV
jgi:excisionase family DNA binding protein